MVETIWKTPTLETILASCLILYSMVVFYNLVEINFGDNFGVSSLCILWKRQLQLVDTNFRDNIIVAYFVSHPVMVEIYRYRNLVETILAFCQAVPCGRDKSY